MNNTLFNLFDITGAMPLTVDCVPGSNEAKEHSGVRIVNPKQIGKRIKLVVDDTCCSRKIKTNNVRGFDS